MKNGQIIEKRPFPSPNPNIRLYETTYISEGLKVKGYLAVPVENKVYPAILYLRGGIKNVGMVRIARVIQFASEGFVVFAPFYRGNRGGEGNEDFAGRDRWDAVNGLEVLRNLPVADSDRIHLFGFSRGGVMALWTAILSQKAASVITWGGVSDVALTYKERVDLRRMMKRVIGGTPWKAAGNYAGRNPLLKLTGMDADVLIIHGKKDENVSVEHAYLLEDAMKKERKPVESWIFPQQDHYFPPRLNREVTEKACRWMKRRRLKQRGR
ncbi:alpha/beta hydrolase family protein [Bacillus marinisedimentorum]|uniref:alpha/beta hydrolase family protein n=1 Tax=Bacillus marinisedimentorum TaxID=1821260 RepID=UPI000872CA11|nr:prolyl oligopeptidase family serine peptidase [Bacillus marinisedimentorum]